MVHKQMDGGQRSLNQLKDFGLHLRSNKIRDRPSLSILPSSTLSRTSTDSKYFMWRLEKCRSFNSVALTFRYPRLKLIIISASKFYRPSSSKHARVYTALQRFRSHVESVNSPKIAVILPPESANSDQDQKTFLISCKKRILYLN